MPESVDWTPTVEDVARYIRARTKVRGGIELGTFTEPGHADGETRPTKEEVEGLIADAVDDVQSAIGGEPCNEDLKESARVVASIEAAIAVETTLAPEESARPGSAASRLEKQAERKMKSLQSSVAEQCGGQGSGSAGGEGNAGATASGRFSDGRVMVGPDYPPRW